MTLGITKEMAILGITTLDAAIVSIRITTVIVSVFDKMTASIMIQRITTRMRHLLSIQTLSAECC
jgi:hypothetical protein